MKIEFLFRSTFIYRRHTRDQLSSLDNNISVDIYFDKDYRATVIDHKFKTDGQTAQIELDTLVEVLARIYAIKPFKKLEFLSHYFAATPEKLMELVIEKYKA